MEWILWRKEIPFANSNKCSETLVIDGKIYAFTLHGGQPGCLQVRIFNEDDVSWELVEHAREPVVITRSTLSKFLAVSHGHVAYLILEDGDGNWNDVRFFDVKTLLWGRATASGCGPRIRGFVCDCAVNGKMVIWERDYAFEVVEGFCLNLNTMVWSKLSKGPMSFVYLPYFLVAVDDKVYALFDKDFCSEFSFAYYDTTRETYVWLDSGYRRGYPSRTAFLHGGNIYVKIAYTEEVIVRYSVRSNVWERITYRIFENWNQRISVIGDRVYFLYISGDASRVSLFTFLPSLRSLCLKAVCEFGLNTTCLPATLQKQLLFTRF